MCHCNDDNVAIIITTARKYEPIQEEVKEGKGEGRGRERKEGPRGERGKRGVGEGEGRGKEREGGEELGSAHYNNQAC